MIGRGSIAAGRALLPEKLLEPPSPGRPHQDCSCGRGLLSDKWPWVGWRVWCVSHVFATVSLLLLTARGQFVTSPARGWTPGLPEQHQMVISVPKYLLCAVIHSKR